MNRDLPSCLYYLTMKEGFGTVGYSSLTELYRELLLTGKLAEHCEEIEERAFKLSEQMQEAYIAKHPLPEEDFWMRVSIRTMAQMVADEVVDQNVILV